MIIGDVKNHEDLDLDRGHGTENENDLDPGIDLSVLENVLDPGIGLTEE